MGVTSLFGLVGCAKAQIGKLVFNLDNPDYGLNVAAIMSSLLDTTQQKIEARYKVDTLKFSQFTETDELFPALWWLTETREAVKERKPLSGDLTLQNSAW